MSTNTNTRFFFINGAMHFQDTLIAADGSAVVQNMSQGGEDSSYEIDKDDLSSIMNEETTQVQDTELHKDIATYVNDRSQLIDAIEAIINVDESFGHIEDADYFLNPIGLDGWTSVVGIIAQGRDDEDMETGQLGKTELSTMESSPMGIEEIIRLLDEDSSMDGTHPATSLHLGEPVDQMGYLLDIGQVDDYELDMDIAEHID